MPIYEYEPVMKPCPMCDDRFAILQPIGEEPLKDCPECGMACRRLVSRVTIKTKSDLSYQKAADRGFTTWKRTGEGQWEKLAGVGVDVIAGDPNDVKETPIHDVDKSD